SFVLAVRRPFRLEEGPGVQLVVPKVIENTAMKLVRAGLDRHVREPVAETAVFRIERVCDNADIADLLHKWTIFGKGSDHDTLSGWSAIQNSLGRAKRRSIDAGSERVRIRCAGKIVNETGHVSFGSDDD